jgi:hypothetical protein
MKFFPTLVLAHFIVDWIFQTNYEAMNKYKNIWIRMIHCLVYTIGMAISFYLCGARNLYIVSLVLFVSHFIEDSYLPVYLWVKYIRRPVEMKYENSQRGFIRFSNTILGKILVIAVDQIIHIVVIWILAIVFI